MKRLTEELRLFLKKPFAKPLNGEAALAELAKPRTLLISVGDSCSQFMLENGIKPDIMVYDLRCMRQPVDEKAAGVLEAYAGARKKTVANEPGTITEELERELLGAITEKKGAIFVKGEEDLAGIVALMHAPDNSIVAYGQPNEGVVLVRMGAAMRALARELYGKMLAA